MSVDTLAAHTEEHAEDSVHNAPSDSTYVVVAVVLAAMTGIEVALSYVKRGRPFPELALITVMILKFVTVCLYFMHLKFDAAMCRRVFFAALGVAVSIYVATLCVFQFWAHGYR